ncbi:hypothetical protein CIPAW_15G108500 [Carya illinoinensis]|uniref:Uncharacterized protein n=1 Tax=Carya illinoinensis TaxID=32201 RepID=A0A8T1NDX4_CARIL|nr:hypothetical protein CIPAW_15G108500 [Carya illinoinensis]KAG6627178.1 hypothetical protein CIPAW_15G108500 [Carya illinoinensis]KAG6627179.1 hypothetical protein CIPAW_15G108500 [Carya illinoinensis]KAG6627180.1 hypothetical protein CIPAW_15G108500 [Carya illinoinensis]
MTRAFGTKGIGKMKKTQARRLVVDGNPRSFKLLLELGKSIVTTANPSSPMLLSAPWSPPTVLPCKQTSLSKHLVIKV